MNYYKRHLGDYAKDAGHLTLIEHGVFTLLLDRYYSTEKPITEADALRVCRARSAVEREAVLAVLGEFFTPGPSGWVNKRADEEIDKAASQADTNRRIAEQREATKRARTEHEPCNEPSNDSCTNREPSHKPLASNHKEQEQKRKGGKPPALTLPDWLPPSVWQDWHSYRNARKGWTAKARQLSLATLSALRDDGHDPKAVVEQSIERGWTGLFEVRSFVAVQNARAPPQLGKTAQGINALEEMKNGLAETRTGNGFPEVALLESGSATGL